VTFGYAVERAATGELLATGETSLVSLTHQHTLTRLPAHVIDLLKRFPIPWSSKTLMLSIVIIPTPRFRFNS